MLTSTTVTIRITVGLKVTFLEFYRIALLATNNNYHFYHEKELSILSTYCYILIFLKSRRSCRMDQSRKQGLLLARKELPRAELASSIFNKALLELKSVRVESDRYGQCKNPSDLLEYRVRNSPN
nr:hypothetical protein CFP56_01203 [Quercus suber]